MHASVVKPTLEFLNEQSFEGAEQEFLKAFEYRRKGDNKNAISEASKSFESTMKTICDRRGFIYDAKNDTAKKLISILIDNNFLPAYLDSHLTGLRSTLESGLPTVRNRIGGHGQGTTIINVSDELTEYALHLAATNILLLAKLYKK